MGRPAKPLEMHTSNPATVRDNEIRKEFEKSLKGKKISNKVPKNLNEEAKKIYKKLLKMFPDGFLTEADAINIEIIAFNIELMARCQEDINIRGHVILDKMNPSISVYDKCAKTLNTFCDKLGMSPKSRAALALQGLQKENKDDDELLKILQG